MKTVIFSASILSILLSSCSDGPLAKGSKSNNPKGADHIPGEKAPEEVPKAPQEAPPSDQGKPEMTCGKDAYCDNGEGKVEWPQTAMGGGPYPMDVAQECFAGIHANGHPASGPMPITVRDITAVSVFGFGGFVDQSKGPQMVILNLVNVLGLSEVTLLNPEAMYCIQGVSVLDHLTVTSCGQGQVTFGAGVNVLSSSNLNLIDCSY